MYRYWGDSNSKKLKKLAVGGQAGKIHLLDGRFFSNFVGGKNLAPFLELNDLRLFKP